SVGTDRQGNFRISYWDGTAHRLKFAWGPTTTLVDVPPAEAAPARLAMAPNPAHAGERVRFATSDPGVVGLEVLDIAGRRMAGLPLGADHAAEWNQAGPCGAAVPPGIYLARALHRDGTRAASTRLVVVH